MSYHWECWSTTECILNFDTALVDFLVSLSTSSEESIIAEVPLSLVEIGLNLKPDSTCKFKHV